MGSEYQRAGQINLAVKNAHIDIDEEGVQKRRKPKDNKNYES